MKIQKRPRKTPTFKQKAFAKAYVENKGNATKAALEVFDTKDAVSAKTLGYQNINKPIVQEEISKLLTDQNLGLPDLSNISKKVIESFEKNMFMLKPSTAMQHLHFLYKLHNALPARQTVALKYSRNDIVHRKTYDDAKSELQTIHHTSQKLLSDLED